MNDRLRDIKQAVACVKQNRAALGAALLIRDPPLPLTQDNLARIFVANEKTRRQLSEHVPPLPPFAKHHPSIDERTFKTVLASAKRKNTQDYLGYTADLVSILYDSSEIRPALEHLLLLILNNDLPKYVKQAFYTRRQLPIPKKVSELRIVSWGPGLTSLANAYALKLCDTKFLQPHQLGAGAKGGPARALAVLQSAAMLYDDQVTFCLDISDAYPSTDRAAALREAFKRKELVHAHKAMLAAYGDPTDVLTIEPRTNRVIQAEVPSNGVSQVCQLATILFCNRIHPALLAAVDPPVEHKEDRVICAAIADDLNLSARMRAAMRAVQRLRRALPKEYEISPKSFALWVHNDDPPLELRQFCTDHGLDLRVGWSPVLGGVLANFKDANVVKAVQEFLLNELHKHDKLFATLEDPQLPPQPAFQVLRLSAAVRIHHLIRQLHPSILLPVVHAFDAKVDSAFRALADCPALDPRQQLQVQLPILAGGFSILTIAKLAPLAYLAGLAEMAVHVRKSCRHLGRMPNPPLEIQQCLERAQALAEAHGNQPDGRQQKLWPITNLVEEVTEDMFWEFYGDLDSANGIMSRATADLAKIVHDHGSLRWVQKALTKSLHCEIRAQVHAGAEDVTAARLNSLPGCDLVLQQPPDRPEHVLRADDYRTMVKLRLGVPARKLPREDLACPCCRKVVTTE